MLLHICDLVIEKQRINRNRFWICLRKMGGGEIEREVEHTPTLF